jgi:hypothetical protein
MALRYTAAFARRDPIGLVTVNRTSGPGARPQRFLPRPALSSGAKVVSNGDADYRHM